MNFLDMLNKKNDEEDQKYEFEKPEFEPVSVTDDFTSSIDAPEMLEETPPRDPLAEGASDLSPFYAKTNQNSQEESDTDEGRKTQVNNLETLYKEYMANIGSRQQRIKDAKEADRRKRLIQNLSNAFSKIGTGLASGYANVKIDPIDLGPANEEDRARAEQKGQLEDLLTQYKIQKAMTPEKMSKLEEAKLAKEKALTAKYGLEAKALGKKEEPKNETEFQKKREKNIADRYAELESQVPEKEASIKEAEFLLDKIEKDELDTGFFQETLGKAGSIIQTQESSYKERLDALAEQAARAKLKSMGETRPTDADVQGMKDSLFNVNQTEKTNITKLRQFIDQQKAGLDEYQQMKKSLQTKKGLEDFIIRQKIDVKQNNRVKVNIPGRGSGTIDSDKLEDFLKAYPDAEVME